MLRLFQKKNVYCFIIFFGLNFFNYPAYTVDDFFLAFRIEKENLLAKARKPKLMSVYTNNKLSSRKCIVDFECYTVMFEYTGRASACS